MGIDPPDRGEEPHTLAMHADRLHPPTRRQVCLTGAGPAHEHQAVRGCHELHLVQVPNQGLIHLGLLEGKAGQIAVRRAMRQAGIDKSDT
jgi:hypothetical protein